MQEVTRWSAEGARVAVARVVGAYGSSPRTPGAAMAVRDDGRVAGSVSGGCVEGAVVEESLRALRDGTARVVRFGYSDDEALAVGLTCGGTLEILVCPEPPPVLAALRRSIEAGEGAVLATVVDLDAGAREEVEAAQEPGPEPEGRRERYGADGQSPEPSVASETPVPARDGRPALGACILVHADCRVEGSFADAGLQRVVRRDAAGVLAAGRSGVRHYGRHGEARGREVGVFLEAFVEPPRMVIFGAVDFTAALAQVAKVLGYRVTVCDARAVFATRQRFPMADEVVVDWPHRYLSKAGASLGPRDAVCVLTHDPKFDVPAVRAALATRVGYLGAMGSRRTHLERTRRLRDAGVGEAELARLMGPIGLDLGARTPEETAVSICAEIISLRSGRRPASLRDSSGPIHDPLPAPAALVRSGPRAC